MKFNRPLITVASFLALGLNGMTFTFMGVSLPSLQTYLEISIEQAGTLMASLQAGFTLFTLLGGIFSANGFSHSVVLCCASAHFLYVLYHH